MGILSGIISYLLGLVVNLMDIAISAFLSALNFNLEAFETYFPAATSFYEVFIGFAVGLLLIMLVFQIFRNFGVMLDFEAEDPLKMLGKTVLFFGMIMYSHSIINYIINLLTDPYYIFLNAYTQTSSFSFLDLLHDMIAGVATTTFMSIVYIILLIVLGWQFLKFIVEIVERYVAFFIILCFAPVVFATGAFKSTSQIFKSWCRMLGSQAMLMLLNVWSIKLFISFLGVFSGVHGNDIIFFFLIGYGFLKQAQKADTLLRILGLNTASAGDVMRSLGGTIGGIAHAIQSAGYTASRTIGGKGSSGSARSGTNNSGGSGGVGGIGSPAGRDKQDSRNQASHSPAGGVTETVTGTAKQQYANEVLSLAKEQLGGTKKGAASDADNPNGENLAEEDTAGNIPQDDINMNQGVANDSGMRKQQGTLDADTKEGLANIAHGLPHDKYDPIKKKFSGGGFPEFTGENANIIGSSQLTPAEGFRQSSMKMSDGSLGTVYKNEETGEAHVIQFGSVDNGVIQGCISDIDSKTGKLGDRMAFKAVHEAVPGADSLSSHSVKITDSEGGAYHLSTGADTSFLASRNSPIEGRAANTSYSPGNSASMTRVENGKISTNSAPAGHSPGVSVAHHASNPHSEFSVGSVSTMTGVGGSKQESSAMSNSPAATDPGISAQGARIPHDNSSSIGGISTQVKDSSMPVGNEFSVPDTNITSSGNSVYVQSQAVPSPIKTSGMNETMTQRPFATHDTGVIHTVGTPSTAESAQTSNRRFS